MSCAKSDLNVPKSGVLPPVFRFQKRSVFSACISFLYLKMSDHFPLGPFSSKTFPSYPFLGCFLNQQKLVQIYVLYVRCVY